MLDEFSYVSYSYPKIGYDFVKLSQDAQDSVDGKVYFAGEHTALGLAATTNGAYLSGRRAAI